MLLIPFTEIFCKQINLTVLYENNTDLMTNTQYFDILSGKLNALNKALSNKYIFNIEVLNSFKQYKSKHQALSFLAGSDLIAERFRELGPLKNTAFLISTAMDETLFQKNNKGDKPCFKQILVNRNCELLYGKELIFQLEVGIAALILKLLGIDLKGVEMSEKEAFGFKSVLPALKTSVSRGEKIKVCMENNDSSSSSSSSDNVKEKVEAPAKQNIQTGLRGIVIETQSDYIEKPNKTEETEYIERPKYTEKTEYIDKPNYTKKPKYIDKPKYTEKTEYIEEPNYTKKPKYIEEKKPQQQPKHRQKPKYFKEPGQSPSNKKQDSDLLKDPNLLKELRLLKQLKLVSDSKLFPFESEPSFINQSKNSNTETDNFIYKKRPKADLSNPDTTNTSLIRKKPVVQQFSVDTNLSVKNGDYTNYKRRGGLHTGISII